MPRSGILVITTFPTHTLLVHQYREAIFQQQKEATQQIAKRICNYQATSHQIAKRICRYTKLLHSNSQAISPFHKVTSQPYNHTKPKKSNPPIPTISQTAISKQNTAYIPLGYSLLTEP